MGKIYMLFRTDDSIIKDIVAVNESLDVVLQCLKNDSDLKEAKRLGQGWKIDLVMYDDSGETKLIPIKNYERKLEHCEPNDIQEGAFYNIKYRTICNSNYAEQMRGIGMVKCITACPPNFVFENREKTELHLNYEDITVISKCRDDEDGDDWDRFQYYSYLLQWKKEHENKKGKDQ